jgi:hypothetical protein
VIYCPGHKAEKSWYRASEPVYIKHRYRLEAYATLLFGASSDSARSCAKTITSGPLRRRDSVKWHRLPACIHSDH